MSSQAPFRVHKRPMDDSDEEDKKEHESPIANDNDNNYAKTRAAHDTQARPCFMRHHSHAQHVVHCQRQTMAINQTDEAAARNAWRVGSRCEINSRYARQRLNGAVTRIFKDADGEWLEVSFNSKSIGAMTKQAQRMSPDIRPIVECDDCIALYVSFSYGPITHVQLQPEDAHRDNRMTAEPMDGASIRATWRVGSRCMIFSRSKAKWIDARIARIFHDDNGEWLEVRYSGRFSTEVQRYSDLVRTHVESFSFLKTTCN